MRLRRATRGDTYGTHAVSTFAGHRKDLEHGQCGMSDASLGEATSLINPHSQGQGPLELDMELEPG